MEAEHSKLQDVEEIRKEETAWERGDELIASAVARQTLDRC